MRSSLSRLSSPTASHFHSARGPLCSRGSLMTEMRCSAPSPRSQVSGSEWDLRVISQSFAINELRRDPISICKSWAIFGMRARTRQRGCTRSGFGETPGPTTCDIGNKSLSSLLAAVQLPVIHDAGVQNMTAAPFQNFQHNCQQFAICSARSFVHDQRSPLTGHASVASLTLPIDP